MPSESSSRAVELSGLTKRFGDFYANRSVSLAVRSGSIHAIIGENGAGKSTAMKILYGMLQPDGGEIRIDGKVRHWQSPRDAIACGIGMVHQHFMLSEPEGVLENIILGDEPVSVAWRRLPRPLRPIDRVRARAKLEKLSQRYGLALNLGSRVEEVSVGIQQRIEIIKLLFRDARILILDEPTAVLTPQETVELFSQLRKLRDEGKTILIITHKLKEVLELADEATVLRAGEVVGHRIVQETDADDLASLMVGRKVNLRASAPPPPQLGEPMLEVRDLSLSAQGVSRLKDVAFQVRGGEIVGIAGVEGNGQSELLRVLQNPLEAGMNASGTVRCLGREVMGSLGSKKRISAQAVRDLGVGFIPEDRHRDGLLLDRPVSENFLLGHHHRREFSSAGMVSAGKLRAATASAFEEYDIRPRYARPELDARRLSGGNQQKLIIAREMRFGPRLLIVAQPTRGVDVGAIEFIHGRILKARASGMGVLLVSSELDEITALSDRILVMYGGRIVAEFARGQADEQTLGLYMAGSA